ncbi:MAG: hypothetical protein QXK06_01225 [Candidatus Diapherotrites archaeon]
MKSILEDNLMQSKPFFVLVLALFFLIVFFGCAGPKEKAAFEWNSGSAFYQSNVGEPKELLRGFSVKEKVVVAIELWLDEPGKNADIFNNAFIPFYAVVAGNDRNAVQVVVFKTADGRISKCHTNHGDLKTQEILESIECESFLAGTGSGLIVFFNMPDASLNRSVVWLEENKAILKAKNAEDLVIMSRSLAEQLYPNAKEILAKTREKLGEVGGVKK